MKLKLLSTLRGLALIAAISCWSNFTASAQTAPNRLWTASGHTSTVTSVAFSPDGTLMVSGSFDKTLKLWRVSDGALLRTFTGHTAEVKSVAFSPDGATVASGSYDQTVKLW